MLSNKPVLGLSQHKHCLLVRPHKVFCRYGPKSRDKPCTIVRATASNGVNSIDRDDEDDYYTLLGISPSATQAEIKKAYYSVMRECHPDLSQSEQDTTEICIFLNEVYETLSDSDRRAAYDEIAGLTLSAVNPFMDTAYEADKVFVDEYTCIGCRNCTCLASKTFGMEEEFGRARVMKQHGEPDPLLQEAIDTCPVNCIYWVTAPQLALLENEMARMERKAAWILNNGGGSSESVFLAASNTWEKQQARLRARLAVNKSWVMSMWQPAASASTYQSAAEAQQANENGWSRDEAQRRKAAASVAEAARKWRDIRRYRRNTKEAKLLTAAREE